MMVKDVVRRIVSAVLFFILGLLVAVLILKIFHI